MDAVRYGVFTICSIHNIIKLYNCMELDSLHFYDSFFIICRFIVDFLLHLLYFGKYFHEVYVPLGFAFFSSSNLRNNPSR